MAKLTNGRYSPPRSIHDVQEFAEVTPLLMTPTGPPHFHKDVIADGAKGLVCSIPLLSLHPCVFLTPTTGVTSTLPDPDRQGHYPEEDVQQDGRAAAFISPFKKLLELLA